MSEASMSEASMSEASMSEASGSEPSEPSWANEVDPLDSAGDDASNK